MQEGATPDRLTGQAQQPSAGRLTRRQVLKRAFALGCNLAAGSTMLAACRSGRERMTAVTPTTGPARGGRITIALSADVTTLDPHKSPVADDRQVLQCIYDRLLDVDARLNIVPQLATNWEISSDVKRFTLTMADGITFHDGTAFDAEAVKINLDRLLDPATASPLRGDIAPLIGVEVPTRKTVVLTLARPYAPLLASLSDRVGMMISPRAIREKGEVLAQEPVGAGPFAFAEWRKGDHLVVRRNAQYWQPGLPYLDELSYRTVLDATQRLAALKANQVQMVDQLAWQDIDQAERDGVLAKSQVAGLGFQYIGLHASSYPFENRALRQAVAWALDRQGIIKAVYAGAGIPAQTPISPSCWAYDPAMQAYQQDYAMAKRKLAEAGRSAGFSFTMLIIDSPEALQLAEAYQVQLAGAGIIANIEPLEFGTLLQRLADQQYEAVSLGWDGRPDPDGNLYPHFHSGGSLNRGLYRNAEVDRLLDQARVVVGLADRKQLYAEATRLIAEDAPMIFVRFPAEIKVWQPAVQGVTPEANGLVRMNALWLRK